MGDNKDKKEASKEDELNIFEEFNSDEDLKKEIEEIKEEKQRDFYFYAINIGAFFKVINLILFLFFSVTYVYFYLQEKEDLVGSKILNPVCNIFLGDINYLDSSCSSVTYALNKAESARHTLKKNQFSSIIKIIPNVYSSINWFEGEEISFLLSKTKNRLRPMEIIEEFDIIKNSFESDDKKKISCENIIITNDFILTAECYALTHGYENKIVGFEGSKGENMLVSGTSASLAASFLNFIDKKSKGKFILIDAQKEFVSTSEAIDGYTKITQFNLRLQYNTDNLLLKK